MTDTRQRFEQVKRAAEFVRFAVLAKMPHTCLVERVNSLMEEIDDAGGTGQAAPTPPQDALRTIVNELSTAWEIDPNGERCIAALHDLTDYVESGASSGAQPPRCEESAGDLIAGASWFVCVLPKGHGGAHRRGGTCFAHGEYVGDQCPEWPECVKKLAGQEALRAQPRTAQPPQRSLEMEPWFERLTVMVEDVAGDIWNFSENDQVALCQIREFVIAAWASGAQPLQENTLQPTYYVRHPDDSYSVADPQPSAQPRAPQWTYQRTTCRKCSAPVYKLPEREWNHLFESDEAKCGICDPAEGAAGEQGGENG